MSSRENVGIMVAHPDDETLWAGGTILLHPEWRCRICTLCRASDPDRAPKFRTVLHRYGADGEMADLDDGPVQHPLPADVVQETILSLLGETSYDILLTHAPWGEYTRHQRHDDTSAAVMALWGEGRLRARELWLFAYEDGGRAYYPLARTDATLRIDLPPNIWEDKYRIIHDLYGFAPESWEAHATPRAEAFWRFPTVEALQHWYRSVRELR